MVGLSILLLALCCATPVAAQQSQPPRHVAGRNVYSLSLLPGWRQMTPSESYALRSKLPADIATLLVLNRLERFGDIDAWQAGTFDGRCLTVTHEDGEPALTPETLAEVRATAAQRSLDGGYRFAIAELEIITLGPAHHPAIECIISVTEDGGRPLARLLEYVVPTGGKTIRFSYRSNPEDFESAVREFRLSAATLEFARPAEGRKELSDKLQTPLIIGGVVGLIFLVLYMTRRG